MAIRAVVSVAGLAFAGCAAPMNGAGEDVTTAVFHNVHGEDVTVAVACGELQPVVLGVVGADDVAEFEIPDETTRCVWGLRFWLMPQDHPRGYMTDAIALRDGGHIDFWIEKYPGLSAWEVN